MEVMNLMALDRSLYAKATPRLLSLGIALLRKVLSFEEAMASPRILQRKAIGLHVES